MAGEEGPEVVYVDDDSSDDSRAVLLAQKAVHPELRVIHHVAAWYFPIFIILHVYLAFRADLLERSGAISSIISGGRFVATDEHYADE